MNNYWKIYWLTRLDYVQGFFITTAVICGICVIMHFIIYGCSDGDWVFLKKWQKVSLIIICAFLSLISCFLPNKNEAILIMAGGQTLDYVQKDTSLSKIPYQTTSIISSYLDKTIKELKDKK